MYYSNQIEVAFGRWLRFFLSIEVAVNVLLAIATSFVGIFLRNIHIHVERKPMATTLDLSKWVVR